MGAKKRALKFLFAIPLLFLVSSPAFAWNCTAPGQIRVQVPNGTKGNGQGDGRGQVVTVEGLTFECEDPPAHSGGSNSNTNSNNNTNSNVNKNTQNQNQTQQQNQNQSQTASVTGSGNSNNTVSSKSVSNATATGGNASATAAGGAGGNASASDNATGSGNTTIVSSTYKDVHQTASAVAPDSLPSAPCIKGFSAAAQTGYFGGSFGSGKVDEGCDDRETARFFALMGNRTAAAKILCQTPAAKRAKLTLNDCMPPSPDREQSFTIPAAEVTAPVSPAPAVIEPVSAAVETPASIQTPIIEPELLGICTFASQLTCSLPSQKATSDPARVTTICDQMLAAVAKRLGDDPRSNIILIGNANASEREHNTMFPLARAENVKRKLVKIGVNPNRVDVKTGKGRTRTVEIWLRTISG